MKTIILFCSILVLLTINPLKADIDSGLVAYYPFNGNTNDESGNNNHGINSGANLTSDINGISDKAYYFNGIDNNINIPDLEINDPENITLHALIFPERFNNESVLYYGEGGEMQIAIENNKVDVRIKLSNYVWYIASDPNPIEQRWYSIVGVWQKGNSLKLYVNGQLEKEISVPNLGIWSPVGYHSYIGDRHIIGSNPFKGKIDEVRTYSRALSQNDITQLFSLGASYCNLSVIPQGFYNSLANKLYKTDAIKVLIRQSISPFSIIDSSSALIDSTNFSGIYNFYQVPDGMYYIIAQHKNCIDTWSSTPVSIIRDSTINYKFTTSISQAYADNMIQVDNSPVRFGIFSGDINKNGFIDLDDLIPVNNDASSFTTGENITTDLNGDRIVDLTDVSICYNNASNFVAVIRP